MKFLQGKLTLTTIPIIPKGNTNEMLCVHLTGQACNWPQILTIAVLEKTPTPVKVKEVGLKVGIGGLSGFEAKGLRGLWFWFWFISYVGTLIPPVFNIRVDSALHKDLDGLIVGLRVRLVFELGVHCF